MLRTTALVLVGACALSEALMPSVHPRLVSPASLNFAHDELSRGKVQNGRRQPPRLRATPLMQGAHSHPNDQRLGAERRRHQRKESPPFLKRCMINCANAVVDMVTTARLSSVAGRMSQARRVAVSSVANSVERAIAVSNIDVDTCVSNFVWHPECGYTSSSHFHELSYALHLHDESIAPLDKSADEQEPTPQPAFLHHNFQRSLVNTNGGRYLLPTSPGVSSTGGVLYSDGEFVTGDEVADDKVAVVVGTQHDQ
mmetsp:Transcript_5506/g.11257  ORF Transcript_5506/g.11257 Transcript_5506/m.11257 type:complete len:255 (-) Transcript_5506:270-1034(-)|eukprot:CAMPEP_0182537206 /NCGR_PEP_ID=MMETSP1323-20130603/21539_1 /TAXON_ID=236787 /ORGANISM="Florenciella parvula, Strain RCC1693" /LENGTH=254 /DNA_ID=CAMNT_0024747555 /DNA_START=64 /DNA_END=828 /DNA_ORIENTATION=+